MKGFLAVLLILAVTPLGASGQSLTVSLDLGLAGLNLDSLGWARLYRASPCQTKCASNLRGVHYIHDAAANVIVATRPYSAGGLNPSYSGTLLATGSASRCYKARIDAEGTYKNLVNGALVDVVALTNNATSGTRCATPPPPPPCTPNPTIIVNEGSSPYECASPIVIDLMSDGWPALSNNPVRFDLDADGQVEATFWTRPDSSVGLLALDRDGDGLITSGAELFGDNTPLADGGKAFVGFIALAEFDDPERGGNLDSRIDGQERDVWQRLRLWLDRNHNGISEPKELLTMGQAGIVALEYDYELIRTGTSTGRPDRFGNVYLAKGRAWLTTGEKAKPRSRPIIDVLFRKAGEGK